MDDLRRPTFNFSAQEIGRGLREIGVDFLKLQSQEIKSRWFHGEADTDLFIWSDERANIIKQQLTFCGQVAEWNVVDGLRTGVVVEEEVAEKDVAASELIRFDIDPQRSTIDLAIQLLNYAESLDSKSRVTLIENFKNPRTIREIKVGEVFGHFSSSPIAEVSPRGFSYFAQTVIQFFRKLF